MGPRLYRGQRACSGRKSNSVCMPPRHRGRAWAEGEVSMPTDDALLAQLKIVNERSGTYGRQFWQVPFAYIAASGVIVAQLVGKDSPRTLGGALLVIGIIGAFAVAHLLGL